MKKLSMILPLVLVLCFVVGCQQSEQEAEEHTVDIAAEEEAVLKADSDWLKSVSERDIARVLEYYHEDAVWLIPKVSMSGKDEIRKFWERDFAGADYGLAWEPTKVEVSQSGDLAYTLGRWSFESKDKEGNTETLGGAYVAVWRKELDGTWKLVIDIHNKGY